MLIYLAAPIESNYEAGEAFKDLLIDAFKLEIACMDERDRPEIVLFDPYKPYITIKDLPFPSKWIKKSNRAVLRQSTAVCALLAGCETWREIEHAAECGVQVIGLWPANAPRSPVAEDEIIVVESPQEMVKVCLTMP